METLIEQRARIRREIRETGNRELSAALFLDDTEPPAHITTRRPRRERQRSQQPRQRVIVGYSTTPSTTHRAADGSPLFDPIVRELAPDAWDGLHEVAANIVGAKLHRVLTAPSEESDTAAFARQVAQQVAFRESLLNQSACGIITDAQLEILQQLPEIPLGCKVTKAAGQPDPRAQAEAERIPFSLTAFAP